MAYARHVAGRRVRLHLHCAMGWLTALCVATVLAFQPSVAESRSISSPDMRQLSAPFQARQRGQKLRSRSARRFRPGISPRTRHLKYGPGLTAKQIHLRQIARSGCIAARRYPPLDARQLFLARNGLVRDRWPETFERGPRRRGHRLMRSAPVSREIVADQLLIVPPAAGYDDDRLHALMALGIPIIPGVPPIAIINPSRDDRHFPDRFLGRKAR
jgi:hypothetical protein